MQAEFTHTNKARISTRKLSAGKEAEHQKPHLAICEVDPYPLIRNAFVVRLGGFVGTQTSASLTRSTPYISVQFHHLVLFWHQSAAHHWCSYVHLSVTQHYKRKLIWVSQSAAECLIRHTVVCVHSALSPLCLFGFSLWPAWSFSFFLPASLSLLIILVSHATLTQIHTVFKQCYWAVSL